MENRISKRCIEIFQRSINDYHKFDRVDAAMQNPYDNGSLDYCFKSICITGTVMATSPKEENRKTRSLRGASICLSFVIKNRI